VSETFMDQVLAGEALIDEIDDYVDAWHDDETTTASLAAYLGMTQPEYDLWAEKPASLRFIVAAREEDVPLYQLIERYEKREPVATRAADAETAKVVAQWLRDTGRISA
jgi:hypothetical protein